MKVIVTKHIKRTQSLDYFTINSVCLYTSLSHVETSPLDLYSSTFMGTIYNPLTDARQRQLNGEDYLDATRWTTYCVYKLEQS